MDIRSHRDDAALTVAISGRVDTNTAPELEKFIFDNTDGVSELVLDLKAMSYTSSAGLRVILKAQKLMNSKGSMRIVNVQNNVMEVFDMTGFTDILTIE